MSPIIKRLLYLLLRPWAREHAYYELVPNLVSWIQLPIFGTIAYRDTHGHLIF